jgi:2-dehydropantoate 2-reductase
MAYGNENVLFLANEERCQKYKDINFVCNGEPCDFRFVSTQGSNETTLDLLFFAVKSTGLEAAIQEARPFVKENTVILSLLNGITSEEQIEAAFGKKHVLYSVALGMDPIREGYHISNQNIGKIVFGSRYNNQEDDIQFVSDALGNAGIPYAISDNIMYTLWKKLMLNTGVNQVIAVYASTYAGMQQESEIRTRMIEAMEEVVEIARQEGVPLTAEDIRESVALLDTMNPEGMPSMRQDTKAGRKTEVELFSGTICRLGRKYNIPTPVNDFFYQKIREIENAYLE